MYPIGFVLRRAGLTTQLLDYTYLVAAFFAIPALFKADLGRISRWWQRHDALFGELSYPVYITHWITTSALAIFLPRHDIATDTLRSMICVLLTLLLSVGLLLLVERPVERWRMRRSLRMNDPRTPGAAVARNVDAIYPG